VLAPLLDVNVGPSAVNDNVPVLLFIVGERQRITLRTMDNFTLLWLLNERPSRNPSRFGIIDRQEIDVYRGKGGPD